MTHTIKILSVYRHYLSEKRGTPLRVNGLLSCLEKEETIDLHVCSMDEEIKFKKHLKIENHHINDIRLINAYIRKNKIDTVVFHTLAAAYYLIPLKLLNPNIKMVLEMHGFLEEEALLFGGITKFKYTRNKFLYSLIYKSCDLITTCSETATSIIQRQVRCPVITIYGGVDLNIFNPNIPTGKYFPKPHNKIIIGYSGNARVWQGLDFLVSAFKILQEKDSNFMLALLLSEKRNFTETENIKIFSKVEHNEVAYFNIDCDILVIPRNDSVVNKISFPSKLMEYLATGKPVVAARTSDMHKIIMHKKTGLLYQPGNYQEFVECILQLKEEHFRDGIGYNGYLEASRNFTWDKQCSILVGALNKIQKSKK